MPLKYLERYRYVRRWVCKRIEESPLIQLKTKECGIIEVQSKNVSISSQGGSKLLNVAVKSGKIRNEEGLLTLTI